MGLGRQSDMEYDTQQLRLRHSFLRMGVCHVPQCSLRPCRGERSQGSGTGPSARATEDRSLLTVDLVSIGLSGLSGNHYSYDPNISSDGRYVAFESLATDLVPENRPAGTEVGQLITRTSARRRHKRTQAHRHTGTKRGKRKAIRNHQSDFRNLSPQCLRSPRSAGPCGRGSCAAPAGAVAVFALLAAWRWNPIVRTVSSSP